MLSEKVSGAPGALGLFIVFCVNWWSLSFTGWMWQRFGSKCFLLGLHLTDCFVDMVRGGILRTPKLSKFLEFFFRKSGELLDISLHASPTARKSEFLISASLFHTASFSSEFSSCMCVRTVNLHGT